MPEEESLVKKPIFHYWAQLSIDGVNSMSDYHCSKFISNLEITARTISDLKLKINKRINIFVLEINEGQKDQEKGFEYWLSIINDSIENATDNIDDNIIVKANLGVMKKALLELTKLYGGE